METSNLVDLGGSVISIINWKSGHGVSFILCCLTIADSIIKIPPERRGRSIQLRSHVSINGATLISTLESLSVDDARKGLRGALTQNCTEKHVKVPINESLRGSLIPLETNVPLLRSEERCESAWACQFIAGKADLHIAVTSASTAGRTFHQPRRNATTNGDVLQGRSNPINEPE
jgi:hypothetical protein